MSIMQLSLPWIKPNPERDGFRVPKSAQQSIPIKRIYKDGVFQVAGKFSKTWRFSDINYAVASVERQQQMLLAWCTVINMLPTNVTSKISLINHKMDRKEFETTQLMALKGERLDHYRKEYNEVVEEKARESNDMIREMFITVSVEKKTVEEARAFFSGWRWICPAACASWIPTCRN